MPNRFYSSVAVQTQLSASITSSDISMTVDDVTGFPVSFPYVLIVDPETSSEEIVDVVSASGNILTINRGIDSTPAVSHDAGGVVVHGVSARDFREAGEHLTDTDGVHGLQSSAAVVGTDEVQTLTNKTLVSPTVDTPTVSGGSWNDATLSIPTIANLTNAQHDHSFASSGGAVPQGSVTGLSTRLFNIESVNTSQDTTLSNHTTELGSHDVQLTDHEGRIGGLEATFVGGFSKMEGGFIRVTPDANGNIFVGHSLGVTPIFVVCSGGAADPLTRPVHEAGLSDFNTLAFRAVNTTDGTRVTDTTSVNWIAFA